jgi:hypothetical protein
MKTITTPPLMKLPETTKGHEFITMRVGYDGNLYILYAVKPTDYKTEVEGWAIFPKVYPDHLQDYLIAVISHGNEVELIQVPPQDLNFHLIQPYPDGRLLLACARCHYRGPDDFDRNARFFSRDGKVLKEITLGDGVEDLQVDSNGVIWTSYFDEGIFGNYGWSETMGESGLIGWDEDGKKIYDFDPAEGLDRICDCYALNVISHKEVWFYYYTDFPLVRLRDRKIDGIWQSPVRGCHGIAIKGSYVLFNGGYNKDNTHTLCRLFDDGKLEMIEEFELQTENGESPERGYSKSRFGRTYLLIDNAIYVLDISELLKRL